MALPPLFPGRRTASLSPSACFPLSNPYSSLRPSHRRDPFVIFSAVVLAAVIVTPESASNTEASLPNDCSCDLQFSHPQDGIAKGGRSEWLLLFYLLYTTYIIHIAHVVFSVYEFRFITFVSELFQNHYVAIDFRKLFGWLSLKSFTVSCLGYVYSEVSTENVVPFHPL